MAEDQVDVPDWEQSAGVDITYRDFRPSERAKRTIPSDLDLAMYRDWAKGSTQKNLAIQYGIDQSNVSRRLKAVSVWLRENTAINIDKLRESQADLLLRHYSRLEVFAEILEARFRSTPLTQIAKAFFDCLKEQRETLSDLRTMFGANSSDVEDEGLRIAGKSREQTADRQILKLRGITEKRAPQTKPIGDLSDVEPPAVIVIERETGASDVPRRVP